MLNNNGSKMEDLVNEHNLELLLNMKFKVKDYYEILDEILEESKENLVYDHNSSALENVKNIVRQHVEIYYSEKELLSGYFIYNRIYLNNSLPEAQQIVTLIHELSHHIYAEIFEKWLKRVFPNVNFSIIESFVMFMLNNSIENRVADEYLSYIVESRFTPQKYQNYISFIQLLIELNVNAEESKDYFIFAHGVSNDVDNILRPLFNDELISLIEDQFVKDNIEPLNQKLTFDYADEHFDDEEKIEIMQEMLCFIFDFFINGEGDLKDLENYAVEFEKNMV